MHCVRSVCRGAVPVSVQGGGVGKRVAGAHWGVGGGAGFVSTSYSVCCLTFNLRCAFTL